MREIVEFVFPNRLHRLAYFLRGITVEIITTFLFTYSLTNDFQSWWIPAIILLSYELFFIILPRIRDVEMSEWWLLGVFVPIVSEVLGLLLLFRRPILLSHTKPVVPDPDSNPQIAFPSGIS